MNPKVLVAIIAASASMFAEASTLTVTAGTYKQVDGSRSMNLYDNGVTLTFSDADYIYKCDRSSETYFVCTNPTTDFTYVLHRVDDHTVESFVPPDTTRTQYVTDSRPPAPPSDPAEAARIEVQRAQQEVAALRDRIKEKEDLQRRIREVEAQDAQFAQYEADREAAHAQFEAEARQRQQELDDSLKRLQD